MMPKALQLTGVAVLCWNFAWADEPASKSADELIRRRLEGVRPTKADVERFLRGKQGPEQLSRNSGWLFDPDLGWILCDSIRADGVHKSKSFYHYEADGARKVVNF